MSKTSNEEKDREKRRLNLILHNVVESTAEDGQAREKEDIDKVSQIFHKNLKVTAKVTNAVRRVTNHAC